jgi:hypothetical protein
MGVLNHELAFQLNLVNKGGLGGGNRSKKPARDSKGRGKRSREDEDEPLKTKRAKASSDDEASGSKSQGDPSLDGNLSGDEGSGSDGDIANDSDNDTGLENAPAPSVEQR